MDPVTQYLESNRDHFLESLKAVLRIPSVSTQPQHAADMKRCAEHVKDDLLKAGLTRAEVVSMKDGHPIVYGEWLGAPGAPTVLVYGHYDVQPVEPLELWHTPPFEPTLREYVDSLSGYQKNRPVDLPLDLRKRLADEWGFCFDEWGYSTSIGTEVAAGRAR